MATALERWNKCEFVLTLDSDWTDANYLSFVATMKSLNIPYVMLGRCVGFLTEDQLLAAKMVL